MYNLVIIISEGYTTYMLEIYNMYNEEIEHIQWGNVACTIKKYNTYIMGKYNVCNGEI